MSMFSSSEADAMKRESQEKLTHLIGVLRKKRGKKSEK